MECTRIAFLAWQLNKVLPSIVGVSKGRNIFDHSPIFVVWGQECCARTPWSGTLRYVTTPSTVQC